MPRIALIGDHSPSVLAYQAIPLALSRVERSSRVHFTAGSRLREIYGADSATEGYHVQPSRAALRGRTPPLVRAFVSAAAQFTP